ncbi:unnamed protein product [Paramecium octaurelia]|uniref:Uncharacterized protein n=1 Tax=Paramecium octaurelia TaxID=43137 RepID=A0A8S1WAI8_PAROT|nr:unnamed protein product [Paramecium octaurelia]
MLQFRFILSRVIEVVQYCRIVLRLESKVQIKRKFKNFRFKLENTKQLLLEFRQAVQRLQQQNLIHFFLNQNKRTIYYKRFEEKLEQKKRIYDQKQQHLQQHQLVCRKVEKRSRQIYDLKKVKIRASEFYKISAMNYQIDIVIGNTCLNPLSQLKNFGIYIRILINTIILPHCRRLKDFQMNLIFRKSIFLYQANSSEKVIQQKTPEIAIVIQFHRQRKSSSINKQFFWNFLLSPKLLQIICSIKVNATSIKSIFDIYSNAQFNSVQVYMHCQKLESQLLIGLCPLKQVCQYRQQSNVNYSIQFQAKLQLFDTGRSTVHCSLLWEQKNFEVTKINIGERQLLKEDRQERQMFDQPQQPNYINRYILDLKQQK